MEIDQSLIENIELDENLLESMIKSLDDVTVVSQLQNVTDG
jgi:hypothetical protein